MITNFEEVTKELTAEELAVVPLMVKGFLKHGKDNPIKAPDIVFNLNDFLRAHGIKLKMTEARLRKMCNYIRANSIIPLIATSNGYFVSEDREIIQSQIKSLNQRAYSIKQCADGLLKFL